MKGLITTLLLLSTPLSMAAVSLRICEQDGITPFDERPIMAGTKLVFYVDSNGAGSNWSGALDVLKPAAGPIGKLIGRGWDLQTNDYAGSHFAAAGNRSSVIDWENQAQQSFELSAAGIDMSAGPWFVLDYNSTGIGDCTIDLVEYQETQVTPVASLILHQFANCDFNNDNNVNFADFAKLSAYWLRTDCDTVNNCDETDLSADGIINFVDLMYFADFWLGGRSQTEGALAQISIAGIKFHDIEFFRCS